MSEALGRRLATGGNSPAALTGVSRITRQRFCANPPTPCAAAGCAGGLAARTPQRLEGDGGARPDAKPCPLGDRRVRLVMLGAAEGRIQFPERAALAARGNGAAPEP